jgi:hypothetical protein
MRFGSPKLRQNSSNALWTLRNANAPFGFISLAISVLFMGTTSPQSYRSCLQVHRIGLLDIRLLNLDRNHNNTVTTL